MVLCVNAGERNCALDLYSDEAVRKSEIVRNSEIIECLRDRFGQGVSHKSRIAALPTGDKLEYVSKSHSAERIICHAPRHSSLQ